MEESVQPHGVAIRCRSEFGPEHGTCIMRQKRIFEAERRAQRIPVLLIFPLVFLIFPAVFLVLFAPIIYRIVSLGVLHP